MLIWIQLLDRCQSRSKNLMTKNFKIFLVEKNTFYRSKYQYIVFCPRPPSRTFKSYEKSPVLKRDHPVLQNYTIFFISFLPTWIRIRIQLNKFNSDPLPYSLERVTQSCEWNDKSANRERESRTRIGSDATFFWDSLSNLVIDDNFRISNNLGLRLAANISTALLIQPDRDREIEII